jgi:ketosteroid isomerase-like protein
MSQENAEVVRGSWQAFADGGLDALMSYFDQEVNWRAIEGAPDDVGQMHGADALRRYLQDWLDTFEDITSVPTELVDVDDDRIVGLTTRSYTRSEMAGSCAGESTLTVSRPSKPWGWRSRRLGHLHMGPSAVVFGP